jgi:uncharacterized protein (DUF1697 family)
MSHITSYNQLMTKYLALLRGINVGGKTLKMVDLTELMLGLGHTQVKTVLASGNVLFDAESTNIPDLITQLESAIKQKFGLEVPVQIRVLSDIQKIIQDNPFSQLVPDKNTHWYVTFLDQGQTNLPQVPTGAGFKFLTIKHNALFSTLERNNAKTVDFMSFIDKQYGKKITTRNWNTLLKLVL